MQAFWEFSQTPLGTVAFILIAVAWLTLVVVWPELKGWWMSSSSSAFPKGETKKVSEITESIRDVIRQLINVRNQINTYKGQPDEPYLNAYGPLNEVQQQIHGSILVKLKSLLPPDEGKDV